MKNNRVRIKSIEILSDNWYTLKKGNFEYELDSGTWQSQSREAYDRGNGAAILLYNSLKKTVILTRQFRFPTYINGNEDGMMLEVPAGVLEEKNPENCIIREVEEETGYRLEGVNKIMEAYMSPGAVTEILYYYTADCRHAVRVGPGGGHPGETENIEVIELPYREVTKLLQTGEIKDAKTILLLQYALLHKIIDAD